MKIDIKNISKDFVLPNGKRYTSLGDITLGITRGDFVVILGESGCGKSTLLGILAGLAKASSGRILVDGKEVAGPHPSRAMLFQQPSLLPWLNVENNIAFGCKLRGELTNLKYRVSQFIELMGLSGFEKTYPSELSVGMAHRVCLARALIGSPEILLLDEPFGALDTFTRARLQEELINLWMSERFTAVFVTHDIEEAVFMGSRIVLLGGKPTNVSHIFENTLVYPRRLTDTHFNKVKLALMDRFKTAFGKNRMTPLNGGDDDAFD